MRASWRRPRDARRGHRDEVQVGERLLARAGVGAPGREEDAVASTKAHRLKESLEMVRVKILQDGVLAVDTAAIGLLEARIAKAGRLHFLLRPLVEVRSN